MIVLEPQAGGEIEIFYQTVVKRGRGKIEIQMRYWHVKTPQSPGGSLILAHS